MMNREAQKGLPGQHRRLRHVSAELRDCARQMRKEPTPAESAFWQAVRGGNVAGHRFRRQHAVGTYVLDFYCPSARLVVEIDGSVHDDPDVAERDGLREDCLRAAGCRIIRFTNAEVLFDLPGVLRRLRELVSD